MTLSPLMKILLGLTLAICAVMFWQSRDEDVANTTGKMHQVGNAKNNAMQKSSEKVIDSASHLSASDQSGKKTAKLFQETSKINGEQNGNGRLRDFYVAETNLFPRQSWLPPRPSPLPLLPPPAVHRHVDIAPAPVPVMLRAIGEWQYQHEQQIIVLEENGQFYLLCRHCDASEKTLPGEHFGGHYRFDRLDKTTLHVTDLRNKHPITLNTQFEVEPSENQ